MSIGFSDELKFRKWLGRKETLKGACSTFLERMNQEKPKMAAFLAQPNLETPTVGPKEVVEHFQRQLDHFVQLIESLMEIYVGPQSVAEVLGADFQFKRIDYGSQIQEQLLNTVLGQCMVDMHLVQQAFNQRRDYAELQEDKNNINRSPLSTLFYADLIAHHAVAPAVRANYIEPVTTIITHFQRYTEARTLPYYKAMLMGIPLMTRPVIYYQRELDYLAIPHEVGHLLYWNGRVSPQDQVIRTVLNAKLNLADDDWRQHWLEELFADFYGCLIAGPVNVLYFQDVLADDPRSVFATDSAKHPIPELRPLIQSEMLRRISPNHKEGADKLDEHWRAIIQERGDDPDSLAKMFDVREIDLDLTGAQIIAGLADVIEAMGDTLINMQGVQPWSQDFSTIPDLQEKFAEYFLDHMLVDLRVLKTTTAPDGAGQVLRKRLDALLTDLAATPQGAQSLAIEDWLDLIFVANWSTGGGEDSHG